MTPQAVEGLLAIPPGLHLFVHWESVTYTAVACHGANHLEQPTQGTATNSLVQAALMVSPPGGR